MKLAAWADRHAARDLYDLAALARSGLLSRQSAQLFQQVLGIPVTRHLFQQKPLGNWETQLAHQTRTLPTADECAVEVIEAYAEILDWPPRFDPFG